MEKRTVLLLIIISSVMIVALSSCRQRTPTWQEQYDLGVRYLSEKNYEEAIIAFTAAIEIDPKQAFAYVGRGNAYMGSGETQENLVAALADYEQAIKLDETCTTAYLGVAEVYVRMGEPEKAKAALGEGVLKAEDTEAVEEKMTEIEVNEEIAVVVEDGFTFKSTIEQGLEYHIPRIVSNSNIFDDINSEIYDFFYDESSHNHFRLVDGMRFVSDYPFAATLTYTWSVLDDILSICVEWNYLGYADYEYYVYNVRISSGESINKQTVLNELALSADDYDRRVRESAATRFLDNLVDGGRGVSGDLSEFVAEQYEKTISDDNVNDAIPYIDDGDLCVAIPIYSIAGADYYWTCINISTYTLHRDYGNEAFYSENNTQASQNISEQELIDAVRRYYEEQAGTTPLHVEIDHYDGTDVVIHIFEVQHGHTATWDWYTIDPHSGIGSDFMGQRIDLTPYL